ncbi:Crp/Fnr family transcriptional regulator [Vibrio mediterranei]|uniref:Crp/Fnr family transcriptional regulator n=1 Tax=Vibrio mediterranei TaxID=689 RepID=UPI00148BE819|nr:cyclic nucleotide-binding domain-containing protein [Vibrio mediterranei]NOI24129.1 Crp/Fnr family transcriptional regulator [Vibrio mediterranei]
MSVPQVLKEIYHTSDELAAKLIERGTIIHLPKGKFLSFQYQDVSEMAIPIQGVLGFYPTIDEGTSLKYDLITPGILINDVPLILGEDAQSDIQAVSDSIVLLLHFDDVQELMDSCCCFAKMLNFSLAKKQRFCLTLFRLRGEKNTNLKIRLAMEAISAATYDGSIPLNILTIASLLNMSRNTVGSYMSKAIAAGEVERYELGFRLLTKKSIIT